MEETSDAGLALGRSEMGGHGWKQGDMLVPARSPSLTVRKNFIGLRHLLKFFLSKLLIIRVLVGVPLQSLLSVPAGEVRAAGG